MPISHGDFFDPVNKWRITFPTKMPFEDRVLAFITEHPGASVSDCAGNLGISEAAVYVACASLEDKGVVKW